nr:hypothetical protein [Pseudolysinimonas kribbensis]
MRQSLEHAQAEVALVHEMVVVRAEKDAVVDVRRTPVLPLHDVMCVSPGRGSGALRHGASAVAHRQCPSLGGGEVSLSSSLAQRASVVVDDRHRDAPVAADLRGGACRHGLGDIVEPGETRSALEVGLRDDHLHGRHPVEAGRDIPVDTHARGEQAHQHVVGALLPGAFVPDRERVGAAFDSGFVVGHEPRRARRRRPLGNGGAQQGRAHRISEPVERSHAVDLPPDAECPTSSQLGLARFGAIGVEGLPHDLRLDGDEIGQAGARLGDQMALRLGQHLGCDTVRRPGERAHNGGHSIHADLARPQRFGYGGEWRLDDRAERGDTR